MTIYAHYYGGPTLLEPSGGNQLLDTVALLAHAEYHGQAHTQGASIDGATHYQLVHTGSPVSEMIRLKVPTGDYRIRPADGRKAERVKLPADTRPSEAMARAQELSDSHGFRFIAERWSGRGREYVCISPGFREVAK